MPPGWRPGFQTPLPPMYPSWMCSQSCLHTKPRLSRGCRLFSGPGQDELLLPVTFNDLLHAVRHVVDLLLGHRGIERQRENPGIQFHSAGAEVIPKRHLRKVGMQRYGDEMHAASLLCAD